MNCMLCPNETPGFFIFCVLNALSLVYIGDKSGGNDMKAIGDVAILLHWSVKCEISDFCYWFWLWNLFNMWSMNKLTVVVS